MKEPMYTSCDLGISPLRAKLLDFASSSQSKIRSAHRNEDKAEAHENEGDDD